MPPRRKRRVRLFCYWNIQRRWYDCRSSTTSAFSNPKVHIRQRGNDFGCFDIDSLQKITAGSSNDRNSLQSDSGNVGQLLHRLIELAEVVYSEPTPPTNLGSFLAKKIEVECVSNEIYKMKSLKAEKRKMTKETRWYDIRDMFRRQDKTDSKRSRAKYDDPEMIIID